MVGRGKQSYKLFIGKKETCRDPEKGLDVNKLCHKNQKNKKLTITTVQWSLSIKLQKYRVNLSRLIR